MINTRKPLLFWFVEDGSKAKKILTMSFGEEKNQLEEKGKNIRQLY